MFYCRHVILIYLTDVTLFCVLGDSPVLAHRMRRIGIENGRLRLHQQWSCSQFPGRMDRRYFLADWLLWTAASKVTSYIFLKTKWRVNIKWVYLYFQILVTWVFHNIFKGRNNIRKNEVEVIQFIYFCLYLNTRLTVPICPHVTITCSGHLKPWEVTVLMTIKCENVRAQLATSMTSFFDNWINKLLIK